MSKSIIHRTLRGSETRDRIEQAILSSEQERAKVARQLRTRFVNQTPHASEAEIEDRVATVLAAWSAGTKEPPPKQKMRIPKEVLAARRAARKAEVRKRRKWRRP